MIYVNQIPPIYYESRVVDFKGTVPQIKRYIPFEEPAVLDTDARNKY